MGIKIKITIIVSLVFICLYIIYFYLNPKQNNDSLQNALNTQPPKKLNILDAEAIPDQEIFSEDNTFSIKIFKPQQIFDQPYQKCTIKYYKNNQTININKAPLHTDCSFNGYNFETGFKFWRNKSTAIIHNTFSEKSIVYFINFENQKAELFNFDSSKFNFVNIDQIQQHALLVDLNYKKANEVIYYIYDINNQKIISNLNLEFNNNALPVEIFYDESQNLFIIIHRKDINENQSITSIYKFPPNSNPQKIISLEGNFNTVSCETDTYTYELVKNGFIIKSGCFYFEKNKIIQY